MIFFSCLAFLARVFGPRPIEEHVKKKFIKFDDTISHCEALHGFKKRNIMFKYVGLQ